MQDAPAWTAHAHIANRSEARAATDLIAQFGKDAQHEAARRASASRAIGNLWHFCRWRQIERLVAQLAAPDRHTRH